MKLFSTKDVCRIIAVAGLLFTSFAGNSQHALQFSKASQQYVTVPHNDNGSLTLTTTFTIEVLVNYSGENSTIVDKGNYGYLWSLNANNNGGKMGFYMFSTHTWVYSTAAVPQNTLTHVAITLSGGTLTFYIDGVASGTAAAFTAQDNQSLNIGRQQPTACQCNHFNGTMDELRIWNVARTPAEILANKNRGVNAGSPGLVAYYKFDEGSGTTTADATANANDGTLVNGPAFTDGLNNAAFISTDTQAAAQSTWTVPAGGFYKIRITAKGGKGGNTANGNAGGGGAVMSGEFMVGSGMVFDLIAGGRGTDGTDHFGGAGGAGSAVKIGDVLILVAGGGGGAGRGSGNAGGGGNTGENGGASGPVAGGTDGNGGAGSSYSYGGAGGGGAYSAGGNNPGYNIGGGGAGFGAAGDDPGVLGIKGGSGFGGGGANLGFDTLPLGGAGGGGYSGGSGNSNNYGGGGGGSYNAGNNQHNSAGVNHAGGVVAIEILEQVCFPGHIAYVDASVAASGSGTDWSFAFKTLEEALAKARSCPEITQIRVAKGTYYPTVNMVYNPSPTDPRTKAFRMRNNLALYGGFAGNEAPDYNLALRDFETNETILSGDLNQDDGPDFTNRSDNSYNVINNHNALLDLTAVLDGFTVYGGFADGANPYNLGGGIKNVNSGGTIVNCRLTGNGGEYGGAVAVSTGNCNIINCKLTDNYGRYGGLSVISEGGRVY